MDLTRISWETVIVVVILIERVGEWVWRLVEAGKDHAPAPAPAPTPGNGSFNKHTHSSPCEALINAQSTLTKQISDNHLELTKRLGSHATQMGILIVGLRSIEKYIRGGKSIIPDGIELGSTDTD